MMYKNKHFTYMMAYGCIIVVLLGMLHQSTTLITFSQDEQIFFGIFLFLIALYRPERIFLLLVALVPLEMASIALPYVNLDMRLYQIVAGILFGAVALRMATGRLARPLPRPRWIDRFFALFLVWGFVSAMLSPISAEALRQTAIMSVFFLLYLLTRFFIQTWEELLTSVRVLLLSGTLVALYGIIQNWLLLHGSGNAVMAGRPHATFAEADWFGMFLVTMIALYYAMMFLYRNHQTHHYKEAELQSPHVRHKLFHVFIPMTGWYLIGVILWSALIITVARSAWLGAGVLIVLYSVMCAVRLGWKAFVRSIVVSIFLIVGAYGIITSLSLTPFTLGNRAASVVSGMQTITIACQSAQQKLPEQITQMQDLVQYGCRHINKEDIAREKASGFAVREIDRPDPNVSIRLTTYKQSLSAIQERWFFGYGWGASHVILGKDAAETALNTSNIFLEITLSVGVIGLSIFLLALAQMIRQACRWCNRAIETQHIFPAVMSTLLLSAFLVPNLFNAGLLMGYVWIVFGLVGVLSTQDRV